MTFRIQSLREVRFRGWLKRWLPTRPRRKARERVAPDDFDFADETDIDPDNPFPEPIRLNISDVFDLHTIAPRDVRRVVEEYLLEAQRAGFRTVRIIHGKGQGVQREIVRSILARALFVEGWRDAPPEAGGWGATVVRLVLKDD